MTAKKTTYADIWETFSKINVSEHTKAKGGFNYLSWTWCWQIVMEHYPNSAYDFSHLKDDATNTMTVICTLTIDGLARTERLPVLDHRNKAIPDPDTMAVNSAEKRSFVKAAALFGLGLHIYQGEGIPDALLKEEASEEELAELEAMMESTGTEAQAFLNYIGTGIQPGIKLLSDLRSIHVPGLIAKLEQKQAKQNGEKEAA